MHDNARANLDDYLTEMEILGLGRVNLKMITEESGETLTELSDYDPLSLASTFGGLLALPELQSNCIRLETLVHVALANGRGKRKPNPTIISRLFSELGKSIAGWKEDPAEDVFVTSVSTPRGNFRVLEGVWECAGFYLQRLVNTLETLPAGPLYDHMREAVYALLCLSDAVCERAGLRRHQLGNDTPVDRLPRDALSSLSSLRRLVKFSEADLAARGIATEHLAEFGFDPAKRTGLAAESIGHTTLERFPVAHRNGEFYFVLPTATSASIRRYVIENMHAMKLREAFVVGLADEYARLFSNIPLVGGKVGAIEFRKIGKNILAGVMTPIDKGRYLNLVFFMDTLKEFEVQGLVGANRNSADLSDDIEGWVEHAHQQACRDPDFREGLTLLVGCGVGRGIVSVMPKLNRPDWRIESVSASDLLTLSWLPKFKPLSLSRIFDAEDRLRTLGVELQNINGLLNLVAWCRSLDGHLVPHEHLPNEFGEGVGPKFVMIEQNALRGARHQVADYWDPHVVQEVGGRWTRVRKDGESVFAEERTQPFFVTEERREHGWPMGVYEAPLRPWWYELKTTPGTSGAMAYERSKMLRIWLCRAAPVLDEMLVTLPPGPVLWRCKFEGALGEIEGRSRQERLTYEEAKAAISVDAGVECSTVSLTVAAQFEDAIFHPENIAERALVDGFIEGFERLAGQTLSIADRDRARKKIVPDASARQTHYFMARSFRDFVRGHVPRIPLMIDGIDVAYIRLGLGWRVRDRRGGSANHGKQECTVLLNAAVRMLEDEACQELRQLDRRAVIMFALRNHESAAMDQDVWQRTSAAVLSVHTDKNATLQTIAEHGFELNAAFQASRLVVEFALCECPLSGGRSPGRLELSRIMARLLLAAGLGGWSDSIRWDATEPSVRVTALGDIQAKTSFYTDVVAPFARFTSDIRVHADVKSYAENLEEPQPVSTDGSAWPREFWDAFGETFGADFDEMRTFVDYVENLGLETEKAVFEIKKSELLKVTLGEKTVPIEASGRLVEFLLFKSRPSWRDVPEGFEEKDCQPWRFRRALSILRKPLIQLDDENDPTIIVTPGLLRDAFGYMLGNYYRGDFPLRQLAPKMKRWAGQSRDRIGHAFNEMVAKRLGELGWETEIEVKLTKLLRKALDRDHGDVDVLAWNAQTARVLVIECKNVQYRKTDGEIAEQLADFRGETRPDGKPDHLMRHLNRVEVISKHVAEVTKHLKLIRDAKVESHLVFRNPVPMQFAWKRMEKRVALHVFAELGKI